ncbi:MAG: phenylalanine--tRNA ligase subunit alpha [Vampirovibrionales bacterium]|nr:phenylalanine--tRNA ligase subunit alpha [Vampirovibrionales bacterium]
MNQSAANASDTPVAARAALDAMGQEAQQALQAATTLQAVEDVRLEYLGRKGRLNDVKRSLKDAPPEERPALGAHANAVSDRLQAAIDAKRDALAAEELSARLAGESIDVTMPGVYVPMGKPHPLTRVTEELCDIFRALGFDVVDDTLCPEVETEYYNFDALNFPPDHPARDMQDTFYADVAPDALLRSQTSNAQIRYMEAHGVPVRIVAPGRVYRNEDVSSKKNVLFHQIEGLLVEEGVSIAHLKGTLSHFIRQFFGDARATRFRTSYFPFTEPSMEMDVLFRREVNGVIKEDWLEILGCGMVDPNVLTNVGVDPERYSGFAFGMGIERLAMLKYGIVNIRDFYANDLRFLGAF